MDVLRSILNANPTRQKLSSHFPFLSCLCRSLSQSIFLIYCLLFSHFFFFISLSPPFISLSTKSLFLPLLLSPSSCPSTSLSYSRLLSSTTSSYIISPFPTLFLPPSLLFCDPSPFFSLSLSVHMSSLHLLISFPSSLPLSL